MRYYKSIEINDFQIIKNKTLEFIEKHNLYEISGFRNMYWDEYIVYCPEILTAFSVQGLYPTVGYLCVSYSLDDFSIHIDTKSKNSHLCRINLPILNCEGTLTEYYTGGEYEIFNQSNDKSYFKIKPDGKSVIKVDEIEIIKPTVIRVQEPHRVITNLNKVPRITMTLKMNKDPVFLLD